MSTLYGPSPGSGGPRLPDAEGRGKTRELLNEELRLRLDVQRKAFERIEARAAIVLGAAFAALQFVAEKPVRSGWLPWALGAYGLAMAFSLIAVLPGGFQDIRPRSVVVGLWLYPRGRAAAELASNRLVAFEANVQRQGRMVQLVRASVALAIAGAMMSTAHLTRGERTMTEGSPEAAPPVPVAAAPAPEADPEPGVPTMNLLETDTRAITGSGGERDGAIETKEG